MKLKDNKKTCNKRVISLTVLSALAISGFVYGTKSYANDDNKNTNVSVELNVEKVQKDKVKIELKDFAPVVKSLQISLKIDGNAKFRDDSINWLATSDANDLKTKAKISSDKKIMDIFIVSSEPLNKNGGTLEICEVNVDKDTTGKSQYTIDANVDSNGLSYSYVINDTNKQVSGIDMANLSEEKLTINSSPVINLKKSSSIADGNIIVSKDSTFKPKDYIEVNDEEDGQISNDNVTVTGKVDTRKVGTYSIKYSVSDSEGDTTTLDQTVIVEEVIAGNENPPTITINNNGQQDGELIVTEGSITNLLDLISATDYLGRELNINIEGTYDLNVAGTYKITIVAIDRLGNESKKDIVLTVEAPITPEQPGTPDGPSTPDQPNTPDGPSTPDQPNTPDEPSAPDKPNAPQQPSVPSKPENGESNSGLTDNNINTNTNNNANIGTNGTLKDELPKTGQGIFYGVVIAVAVAIIGGGVYLLMKKKK